MKLKISFKHLEHTPALDQRISEKSEHFKKYFHGNITVQWLCWVHNDEHWAEVKIHGPKFDFFAKASADNLYKSLDLVVEKVERQFEKRKDMSRNKIHKEPYGSPKHRAIQEKIYQEEKVYYEEWDEKTA
jgi:putative sigma-54 modulation protein